MLDAGANACRIHKLHRSEIAQCAGGRTTQISEMENPARWPERKFRLISVPGPLQGRRIEQAFGEQAADEPSQCVLHCVFPQRRFIETGGGVKANVIHHAASGQLRGT